VNESVLFISRKIKQSMALFYVSQRKKIVFSDMVRCH
jgi:hypothetical protein